MKDIFNEVFNRLSVGIIITINFSYYRVLSFTKSDKTMFGTNLIDMEIEEVKFSHNNWDWTTVGEAEKHLMTPHNITITAPVDYVLLGDRLKDQNGSFVDTFLDIEDDDFDDTEHRTRFMLSDNSLYSDFRSQHHIVDRINTLDYHHEEVASKQKSLSIDEERMRKINLID